jgi:uncharacterized protein (DUF433 family)/DNA-binding transcriptional MerR regulator
MKSRSDNLGVGFYALPQAARLLGLHTNKLRRWVGGFGDMESVIERDCPFDATVTFTELMELMFVRQFRDEGVSMQAIRKAANAAAKKLRSRHPFAVKRFDTDGRHIFVTARRKETDKTIVEDLVKGQLVFEQIIKPFFRKLEYGRKDVMRYWPQETDGRVVLDPERRFGQPIDAETGVPAVALAQAVKADKRHDVSKVAKWFDVPKEAVQAAVSFEKSLTS